tara:strand:+ start:5768 stop:6871 length:1104 start_codon:yes stop_codon:yes gene_type:complete
MANNQLITGAKVAAKKFVDIGGAMKEGFLAGSQSARGFARPRTVTKNQEYQNRVNSLMGKMKTDIDFTSFSPQETASMRTFLVNGRQKYAKAAKAVANMTDTTSSDYMAQVDIMNGVNASFINLADQIKSYKKSKVEFVDGMMGGAYSDGNEVSNTRQNTLMYTNKALYGYKDEDGDGIADGGTSAPLTIMEGGNLGFNIDGEVKAYNESPMPLLKDYELGVKLLKDNEAVRTTGELVNPAAEKMYRLQLEKSFANQDSLRSFIYDFEDEFPTEQLGVAWEKGTMTVDEIRKETINRLIESRKKAGQDGYNEKQSEKNQTSPYNWRKAVDHMEGQEQSDGSRLYYLYFKDGVRKTVDKKTYDKYTNL